MLDPMSPENWNPDINRGIVANKVSDGLKEVNGAVAKIPRAV
jgi:hypothetical protein